MTASVVFLGIAIGTYLAGMSSDKFGRKVTYAVTACLTGVFGIATSFARTLPQLLALRTCLGIALGGAPSSFAYFAEFLSINHRGSTMVWFELFWCGASRRLCRSWVCERVCVCVLIVSCLHCVVIVATHVCIYCRTFGTIFEALLAYFILEPMGWRWLLFFSSIPIMLLVLVVPLLPGSPRFFVARGDVARADAILHSLAASNKKQLPGDGLAAPPRSGSGARAAPKRFGATLLALFSPAVRATHARAVRCHQRIDTSARSGFLRRACCILNI